MTDNAPPQSAPPQDENKLIAERRTKLDALRAQGLPAFPNDFRPDVQASELHLGFGALDEAALAAQAVRVRIAGRMMLRRIMGKASFATLQDASGQIQVFLQRDSLAESYEAFKGYDIGDILGVEGVLFRTRTGELTVRVESLRLLVKSLRPLPDKWHGLADTEARYRQRYVDLIMNESSRAVFRKRTQLVRYLRDMLDAQGFMEVETPMMQPIPGGAAARPFVTHHNALDIDMYLRIAPELYLKRLVVGGFERVYEINRNFRNEGLSTRHNPEFTMLELYQAYTDYRGMMELIRSLVQQVCREVLGSTTVPRPEGGEIELGGEWREVRYKDLILERTGDPAWFSRTKEEKVEACRRLGLAEPRPDWEDFEVTNEVFAKLVEPTLIQPTFVTHIPRQLCPLAKITPDDPDTIDVFELCINGQEIAPAYSEQNDPLEQRRMLEVQAGAETHRIDEDFLLALEHGMPPAGGLGVGIDRLVVLLTGAANIRDTILFPTLRPEVRE